jgi:hypothetical protein
VVAPQILEHSMRRTAAVLLLPIAAPPCPPRTALAVDHTHALMITSPPPHHREARIAARRRRVQEKLAQVRAQAEVAATAAAHHGAATAGGSADAAPAAAAQQQAAAAAAHPAGGAIAAGYPKAAHQVAESHRRLLRLRHRTTQDVTAVRVSGDEAEAAHRAAEEQLRHELRSMLLAEAERSAAANAELASGWPPLFDIPVPQKLWGAMEEQRAACEAIIASKDALVAGELRMLWFLGGWLLLFSSRMFQLFELRAAFGVGHHQASQHSIPLHTHHASHPPPTRTPSELKGALRSKDDEYVRLLKRQAAEVDALLVGCFLIGV